MGQRQNGSQDLPTFSEARKWFKDYIAFLYRHIGTSIQSTSGRWGAKRIEFVFSLPCTFNKLSFPRDIRDLVVEAGFEGGGPQHKEEIGLTEPEAATVYTLKDTAIPYPVGRLCLFVMLVEEQQTSRFLNLLDTRMGE